MLLSQDLVVALQTLPSSSFDLLEHGMSSSGPTFPPSSSDLPEPGMSSSGPTFPPPFDSDQDLILISSQNESSDTILQNFANNTIDANDDLWLDVQRDDLWCICLAFYKLAMKHTERLKKNLCVKFLGFGELGIDAGALRRR
jgi:hypothetical protein